MNRTAGPLTQCTATTLCAHPSWQITHGPTCGCCGNVVRDVFCYTCGGSWSEEITHGQACRDGEGDWHDGPDVREEPPFAMAPDVEQEDA